MKSKAISVFLLMIFSLILNPSISYAIPKWHDQYNNLLVNGESFFPIGIYSVNPPAAFDELKKAGFNTVQSYEISQEYLVSYLLKAKGVGLKVDIYPGTRIGDKSYSFEKLTNAAKELKNNSALLVWQLVDEPDLQKIPVSVVAQLYKTVSAVDATHPTDIVISKADKLKDYVPYADIIKVDPYPIPGRSLTLVSDMIDKARFAVGNKKPVWVILQAYGYQDAKNKGWGRDREPTFAEERCMTYLAITHGAKGIFYYTYHGSQYYIRLSPKHWEEVKRIAGELRDLTPVLLAPVSATKVDIKVAKAKQTDVHYLIKEFEGKLYLIAVNTVDAPLKASFHGLGARQASVEFEKRSLGIVDGSFEDDFKPYEVHIYKILKN